MKKLREIWNQALFHLRSLFGLLLIVLSCGFMGCKTDGGETYVPPWTPPAVFDAAVESVEYSAANTEHGDITTVIFRYDLQHSWPINFVGDQRTNFMVGRGYEMRTSAFGQDMRTGARSSICFFEYGGCSYVVSFYSK